MNRFKKIQNFANEEAIKLIGRGMNGIKNNSIFNTLILIGKEEKNDP